MNEKTKHTTGKWTITHQGRIITDKARYLGHADYICSMPFSSMAEQVEMPEASANATLIMAAPCLLSACKLALDRLMNMGEPVGNQDTGRRLAAISTLSEAIRKAEGK